jgi:serine/threonine protein kinase
VVVPPLIPGGLIAGRYRLVHQTGVFHGANLWKAADTTLGRSVSITTLPDTDDRAPRLIAAARSASAVMDGRFVRVLDADISQGEAYIVAEWVEAPNLTTALADGPLPDEDVRRMAADLAQALDAAHTLGIAHLLITTDAILWGDRAYGLKISGLATSAVLTGATSTDPADTDLHGIGTVVYAGVTGRTPMHGERPARPRQIRAGVPDDLDSLAYCLLTGSAHQGQPLRSPRQLAEYLRGAVGPKWVDIPDAADAHTQLIATASSSDAGMRVGVMRQPRTQPVNRATRLVWIGVSAVLVVAVLLAGLQMARLNLRSSVDKPRGSASPAVAGAPIPIAEVTDFDPEGDGQENPARVARTVDSNTATYWQTKTYRDPAPFGGLKTGVGLVLDLGSPQQVGAVTVNFTRPGATVELKASLQKGATAADYTVAATAAVVTATVTLRPGQPVIARYLLVWLTALPSVGTNANRAEITEITIRR